MPALLSCAVEDDSCNGCTDSRHPHSQEYLSRKDGGDESERGRVLGQKELMRVLYQVCWEELVSETKKKTVPVLILLLMCPHAESGVR